MQLSSSALGVYKECRRCFYYDRRLKIPRPFGIKSGMPVKVDEILKSKFDAFRGKELPEILRRNELDGYQFISDMELLKDMRNWQSSPLSYSKDGNVLVGAFDDVLFNPSKKTHAMLDYKSTGKEPDENFAIRYYQKQVDIYTLFFEHNGWKHESFGVLLFFWPIDGEENKLSFGSKAFVLKADTDRARALFDEAIECLSGNIPPSSMGCEYCRFIDQRKYGY